MTVSCWGGEERRMSLVLMEGSERVTESIRG